jgi:FdhD protein
MQSTIKPIKYLKYNNPGWEALDAKIIVEAPVTLTINGEDWLTFMCTPTNLEELAAGFLFNEGLVQSASDLASVYVCEQATNVDIWTNNRVEKPAHWSRTSGCTGGMTSSETQTKIEPAAVDELISPQILLDSMDQLFKTQQIYQETRGVHCSALSDGFEIRLHAEDIGRHNTLDKLAGMLLLHPIHLDRRIVLTTGRVSSEMLQKSTRLGASVIISRTSPSSMSIQLAQDYGITLIGYARHNQFYVYAHPERLSESVSWVKASEQVELNH